MQLRLREDLRGGRALLTVSINRCFENILILAKRGTLFKTLKPGPAAPINTPVFDREELGYLKQTCSATDNPVEQIVDS